MNKNEYERIQLLLDKYIAGETRNDEESMLREFFATHHDDIPMEWQPYRALFCFIEKERNSTTAGNKEISHDDKRKKRKLSIVSIISVAAALLLLFTISLGRKSSDECYMIIDGKKYTDKKEIRAEALEALQMVGENDDEDPFSAMKMMR